MEIGKLVGDLDIDNDRVLLSTDLEGYVTQNQVGEAVNQALKNLNIGDIVSDVLAQNLSVEVLKIISVNNVYVADVLDGVEGDGSRIDSGGALA